MMLGRCEACSRDCEDVINTLSDNSTKVKGNVRGLILKASLL